MSIEVAGPMTTHPQQFPEGGHPPVGGHGVTGSADPLQVGVILRSPSERADPLEQEETSATDALVIAEDVTKLPTNSSEQASPRQPPTVSDTTAAALPSSTYAQSSAAIRSITSTPEERRTFAFAGLMPLGHAKTLGHQVILTTPRSGVVCHP